MDFSGVQYAYKDVDLLETIKDVVESKQYRRIYNKRRDR